MNTTSSSPTEPKIRQVLREDFRSVDFKRSLPKDYAEMKEFFLDDDRRARLGEMKRVKRAIYTVAWLLKSLFLKLTPLRRLLLTVAILLMLLSNNLSSNQNGFSVNVRTSILPGVILLFVLMLELKDKLIAHSELEEGRAVQSALMPEKSPQVQGWSLYLVTKTANDVGGDLVDFLQIDPLRYLVSLADVAGKGLKAALVTSKLQSTIRALAPESPSLRELAAKTNAVFHRDTIRTMFASLVCIEFLPDSGSVRLVNAGHIPPVKISGSEIKELEKGDAAIGIFPEVSYSEQVLELEKNESLLVYSDGLPDAKNLHGEFFGNARLFDVLRRSSGLSSPEIAERIMSSVGQFVGEAKVYDDLSLIVLKRTS